MPGMIDGARYSVAGLPKPLRNEPAGDGGRRRRGLDYGDLADAKVYAKERDATGREQGRDRGTQQLGRL